MIKRGWTRLILTIGLACFLTPILAITSTTESLQELLMPLSTLEGKFEQVIKNERGETLQYFSGKVWLKKPGQFRWEVLGDEPRLVVSDGHKVWDYDKDLEQVIVQKLAEGQIKAPIFFLTGDIKTLDKDFKIHQIASKKGECLSKSDTCFQLAPKGEEGAFQWIKIGFKDNVLMEMELLDQLGQDSRFSFKEVKMNQPIPVDRFEFKSPKGVDVLEAE